MESSLDGPLQKRIRELENGIREFRRREQMLAGELETLQQVATQLITAHGMEALYDQILDTALAILNADLATIQMVHPKRGTNGELKLLAHRGFSEEAAQRWVWIGADSRTTCGEALRTGQRVIVPDVRHCDFMAGSKDLVAFLEMGIQAAQTLPLVSRSRRTGRDGHHLLARASRAVRERVARIRHSGATRRGLHRACSG